MENGSITEQSKNGSVESFVAKTTLDFTKDDKFLADFPEDSKRIEGQGHYRLAKVYYDKSDLRKAEEHFLKSMSLCEYPRDAFPLFKVYGFLVRIYSEALNAEEAEKFIQKSESLVDDMLKNLGSLNAEFFYDAGVVKNYRGNFAEAKENFQLAYKKAQEENEPELVGKCLYALATCHFNTRDFDMALNLLNQLEELLLILKKDYLRGSMYILKGSIYLEKSDYESALKSYEMAIAALQDKSSWNMYCYILLKQGVSYKKMGEFNKSLMFFNLARNSINKSQFRRLHNLLLAEIQDVNDSSVDLYLDRQNRVVHEKNLGQIDFKHRFVLLEILFLLARNAGIYFDKEDLAKEIWKDEYNPLIHDKLIYTSVSRLRKLIEPKNGKRQYIIRGKDGYTFNPEIKARFHREAEIISFETIGNVEICSPV